MYMPRFNHRDGRKRDYIRGFGCQFWYTGAQTDLSWAKSLPGFGLEFKKSVKARYPAVLAVHPFGETIPKAENRITVKGSPLDQYGVPIARISYGIGENERRMSRDMYDTMLEIMHAAKAEIVPFQYGFLEPNGSAIHEHGTCRMGTDPKRSALNSFCQMHEVKNVFVVDGAAFTTASEKNPTLTILALAWRATDYAADEMRRGNI
jgi:choline dehydrogenase-like flavoprotein